MTDQVIEELGREEMTPFHERLLTHVVSLVDHSRQITSNQFATWDKRQKVYEAEKEKDLRDRKAEADNEPRKMVLPLTTAQINTYIAACLMLLRQRSRMFELDPNGAEDVQLREPSEMLLERDLRANKGSVLLHQFFLDQGRFGIGIIKHQWVEEKKRILVKQTQEVLGSEIEGEAEYEEVRAFVGNRIDNISPYKFFPDVRMPLTRFQEGEFCASEDEFTKSFLRRQQADKMIAGVEHIPAFTGEILYNRSSREDHRFVSINKQSPETDYDNVCVVEAQVWIVPNEFEMENGEKLGKEDFPVLYLVAYANDQRVIRVEPLNNYHSGFTYEVAQYTPDQHRRLSRSLADLVGPLQELSDWYLNARVEAVKKTLENNLVVDPRHVDMKSLKNRSPYVLLTRTGAGSGGISRYVMPLPVQDNTARHFEDLGRISSLLQQATGVNDPALGQAQTGRRSATEMRAVTQGAATRIVTQCLLAWEQALSPLGAKMLTNHRQNVDFETYKGIVGDAADETTFTAFKAGARALIGKEDLFVFDGVSPSEKAFMAQSLQELLITVLQSPEIAIQSGFNPMKMLKEIYELRGLTGLERFQNTPEEQQEQQQRQMLLQLQARANGATGSNGQSVSNVRQ